MPFICTVRIPLPLTLVQEIEKENAQILTAIRTAARKHMQGHSRYASEDQVLDIDEYASREEFDAFMAEAGEAVKEFGKALGSQPVDELWEVIQR